MKKKLALKNGKIKENHKIKTLHVDIYSTSVSSGTVYCIMYCICT